MPKLTRDALRQKLSNLDDLPEIEHLGDFIEPPRKRGISEIFAEIDAAEKAEKAAISRRAVLLGLTFLAAPAVIRCSASLMPVRHRPQFYDKLGFRNWEAYPPSLAEVKAWRAGLNAMHDRGIHVSWNAHGFNEIGAMGDAERRFEALGLL